MAGPLGMPQVRTASLLLAAAGALLLLAASPADAQALLGGNQVAMGVGVLGTLGAAGAPSENCNLPTTALRFDGSGAPLEGDEAWGCEAEGEGWGLGYDGGTMAWAVNGSVATSCGPSPTPVVLNMFATAPYPPIALSSVQVGNVRLNQTFYPLVGYDNVFLDRIAVTNTGSTPLENVTFVRVMPWGAGADDLVEQRTLNWLDTMPTGYPTPPAYAPAELVDSGLVSGTACPHPYAPFPFVVEGTDPWRGPPSSPRLYDNGHDCPTTCVGRDVALAWRFNFGSLQPGQQSTYGLFYGAAADVAGALATIDDVGFYLFDIARPAVSDQATFFIGFAAFCDRGEDCGNFDPPPPPPPPIGLGFAWTRLDPIPLGRSGGGEHCWALALRFEATAHVPVPRWTWEFGDGSPAMAGNPATHLFTSPGRYVVSVTAETNGTVYRAVRSVEVAFPDPCPPRIQAQPPVTVFAGDRVVACATATAGMGGILSFAVVGAPSGTVVDLDGPCMDWTPGAEDVGDHPCIQFKVTESPGGLGAMDCQTIRVLAKGPLVADSDQDGVADPADVCPEVADPDQADTDRDGKGDACDPVPAGTREGLAAGASGAASDADSDGHADALDVCPWMPDPAQEDLDGDGFGDLCDIDRDGDGVADRAVEGFVPALDNCPLAANADQRDSDGDGRGDLCQGVQPARSLQAGHESGIRTDASIPFHANSNAVAWAVGIAACALPAAVAGQHAWRARRRQR